MVLLQKHATNVKKHSKTYVCYAKTHKKQQNKNSNMCVFVANTSQKVGFPQVSLFFSIQKNVSLRFPYVFGPQKLVFVSFRCCFYSKKLVFLRFRCFFGPKHWFSSGFVDVLVRYIGFPSFSLLKTIRKSLPKAQDPPSSLFLEFPH